MVSRPAHYRTSRLKSQAMQDLADRCATIKATVRLRLCREILRRSVLSRRLDAARKALRVVSTCANCECCAEACATSMRALCSGTKGSEVPAGRLAERGGKCFKLQRHVRVFARDGPFVG